MHSQGQKREQKHRIKNFVEFHNHSSLLTMMEATSSRWRWPQLSPLIDNTKRTAFLSYFLWNFKFFSLLHVKSAPLIAFNNAFNVHNPQSIWSHFSGMSSVTKNTCLYWSNSNLQKPVIFSTSNTSFNKNQEFGNRTFNWVRLPIFCWVSSIWFDCRTQSNSIHGLGSIEFDWNSVRLGLIDYSREIQHWVQY